MSGFEALWEDLREQLEHDYRDEDDRFAASCTLVAIEIARNLHSEGKIPFIFDVRGTTVYGTGNTKTLTPLPYGGRVKWGAHIVCVSEGVVYDPILPAPTDVYTYPAEAFGEDVSMTDCSWILEK